MWHRFQKMMMLFPSKHLAFSFIRIGWVQCCHSQGITTPFPSKEKTMATKTPKASICIFALIGIGKRLYKGILRPTFCHNRIDPHETILLLEEIGVQYCCLKSIGIIVCVETLGSKMSVVALSALFWLYLWSHVAIPFLMIRSIWLSNWKYQSIFDRDAAVHAISTFCASIF